MHPSDEHLVTAYLDHNDQRAFNMLVSRHQERIFGYLMGMVRDRDTANDLFQETFLRVIKAMHNQRGSYTKQGRWLAWVMRIARNATLDFLRSRKKWQDVEDFGKDESDSYWERLPANELAADELLHLSEQKGWLKECIDMLSPDQREVLLLRHESDLTFREIAQLTDCSINTALGRMRYALLNLRRHMIDKKKQPAKVSEL